MQVSSAFFCVCVCVACISNAEILHFFKVKPGEQFFLFFFSKPSDPMEMKNQSLLIIFPLLQLQH